ncbi:ribonuclease Z [Thermoanaerobacterium saccharolyticum]|uniref:ribonuclease Z n=1 Tax=Thermoanaerobacterium saccharolyticum TaxID=28896 RepID=UPI0005EDDF4A
MFDVCLLGTGGMMPVPGRNLSSLILRYGGISILVDCGEGTQVPLQKLGWGFLNIDTVFFTHYHADHIMGLPGIIYQMINQERKKKLTLMGPEGIDILKNLLNVLFVEMPFEVEYTELKDGDSLNVGEITVKNAAMQHTSLCLAYSFEVKRLPKFDAKKAKELNIPLEYWHRLQHGESIVKDGNVMYTPQMVLSEDRKGLKVSYSTDTRPTKDLIKLVENSDLFIGEGMYGDPSDEEKAVKKYHSTFLETALVAKEANVKELWLTHFSPSLKNPDKYLKYAKDVFENSVVGFDMMTKELRFKNA